MGRPPRGDRVGIWRIRIRQPGSSSRRKPRRIVGGDCAHLELAEPHSDADPRAAAERNVGALGELRALFGREAFGPEGMRVAEHVRQPVACPGRVVDRQPRGHGVAAELEVLRGAAGPDPGGRVEAERLVDRHPQLGQLAEQLRRVWGVVADDAVALGRQALGPLGLAGELVEEECHGRGRGVVAREQQRQHLVANLRVGEAHALAVLGLDQQPEDVLAGLAGAPAAGDLAEDDPVEGAAYAPQPGERASRAAHHLKEVLALIEGKAALEGGRDVDPGPIRVEPEQRPHRDPHRHMAGPVVQVDPIPRSPAVERALGLLGHHARRSSRFARDERPEP